MIPETLYKTNTKILRTIYLTAAKSYKPEWKKLFNFFSPKDRRPFFEDLTIAEFGTVPEKIPGHTPVYDNIREAYSVKYTYITLALGFRIAKELEWHDQFQIVKMLVQLLAYSMNETEETRFWNMFNLAFSANATGGDGKALCDTAHPLKKGGTASNMVASTAFSVTAYQNAKINFMKTKSDAGNFSEKTPKILAGPLDLIQKFFEVQKSEQAPYTTDNEKNIHFNDGITPINTKRITSTTAWFLAAAKAPVSKEGAVEFQPDSHHLNVVYAWDNQLETDKEFGVGSRTLLDKRLTYGFSDWRGIYGSQGA